VKSVVSRFVVAGAVVVSAAGWFGAQPASVFQAQPAESAQSAPVRDRAAWQPSPVPAKYQTSSASELSAQPAAAPAPEPAPERAPSLAPAPVGGITAAVAAPAPASLAGRLAEWLAGLFRAVPATSLGSSHGADGVIEPIPGAEGVIPFESAFHHDRLEAASGYGMPAERGEWRTVTFFSRALGRESTYIAWLPPGYATSGVAYPSLYLLHGVGDGESAFGVEEWLGYALTEDLDRMLALGLIEPMIVVLPYGEQSYWMNHANGTKWGDFVAVDLVKHVDATFRTDAVRERRAIGGLSMGGHGALQLAYNHPDTFAIAGAHSPTIRPFETSPEFFGDAKYFAQFDPISLARSAEGARRILTWIDVGADDQWREGAEKLAATLAARRAPFELRVLEGDHDGWYWKYYLPEYLHFYSEALHTTRKSASGAPQVSPQLLTASVSQSLATSAPITPSADDGALLTQRADF
jgi:enterochelin esterase-like enzyme